jgi:hypothetical protein
MPACMQIKPVIKRQLAPMIIHEPKFGGMALFKGSKPVYIVIEALGRPSASSQSMQISVNILEDHAVWLRGHVDRGDLLTTIGMCQA